MRQVLKWVLWIYMRHIFKKIRDKNTDKYTSQWTFLFTPFVYYIDKAKSDIFAHLSRPWSTGWVALSFLRLFVVLLWIVSHLPGRHLPPPKFGHLPPPNSDIYHPKKPYICQEDNCHPHFFFFFWRTILGFFDLQLMKDIKDGEEEVLDEVVMEHIK